VHAFARFQLPCRCKHTVQQPVEALTLLNSCRTITNILPSTLSKTAVAMDELEVVLYKSCTALWPFMHRRSSILLNELCNSNYVRVYNCEKLCMQK
jgi:hypothetical protein